MCLECAERIAAHGRGESLLLYRALQILRRSGPGKTVRLSTLPVAALAFGIGVDYGIYIYARLERYLDQGFELAEAYRETLRVTGKAVLLTGLTASLTIRQRRTWIRARSTKDGGTVVEAATHALTRRGTPERELRTLTETLRDIGSDRSPAASSEITGKPEQP